MNTKINREVIGYVQSQFDNGNDGYSDDILLDGLVSRDININMTEFIRWDNDIYDLMDLNFGDSNFEIAKDRFMLRLVKRGMFTTEQIYRIFIKYDYTKRVFYSYVQYNEINKDKIWEKIDRHRTEQKEELLRREGKR